MKHPNAEMIKAKADNMELVVFTKSTMTNEWEITHFGDLVKNEDFDFFLCLPKHKEAVLNCLNGGESEIDFMDGWSKCNCNKPIEWGKLWWYMDDKCESRIKPHKEKRWILINKALNRVCNELYDYQPKDQNGWVSHEIEVEV